MYWSSARIAAAFALAFAVFCREALSSEIPQGADERWSARFFPDAPIGEVYAVTYVGSDLYVTGIATVGPGTRELARWDGHAWTSILDVGWGGIHSFAVLGDDLYAAGSFNAFGGPEEELIARWDGSAWWPLGSGLDDFAYDLHVWKGELYACGAFEHAGGVAANHVAKWDGNAWSAVGEGLPVGPFEWVTRLESTATTLYAISMGKVAAWNGESWSFLEPQNPGYVSNLAVLGDDLYAAGHDGEGPFQDDDRPLLVRWNGTQWIDESDGLSPEPDYWIHDLEVVGTTLYVAENLYDNAYSTYTPRLRSFDGQTWSLVSDKFTEKIGPLTTDGNTLLVAGDFHAVGSVAAPRLAKWNGIRWRGIGYSGGLAPSGWVETLSAHDGELYAGGRFRTVADVAAYGIAKWNGTSWSAMEGGTDGNVLCMLWDGDDLYAGGGFTRAGNASANGIARWNGTSWSALGEGLESFYGGSVLALAKWKGDLYAGGAFTRAGGERADYIAKWDGENWTEPGGGLNHVPIALAATDDALYLAGDFDLGENVLKRWDGASFTNVEGLEGSVTALAAYDDKLVVAGSLQKTGDVVSPGLVFWDESQFVAWPVPLPEYSSVNAMAVSGSDLFVAGNQVGERFVARWDGQQWTSFGTFEEVPFALAAVDGNLFLGGYISEAGGKLSHNLARYRFADSFEICGDTTGDEIVTSSDALGVLRAAVGTVACSLLVCDFNGDQEITASDALATLQAAVGLPVSGLCS